MEQKYFKIYNLLEELNNPLIRFQKIHEIIKRPDFQYKKAAGADFILGIFAKSCYWLDKELFDESYLYQKENQNLSAEQMVHLKMVEIGALLLEKGFPLEYKESEYEKSGLKQLAPYVKTFVKQCHKKHACLLSPKAICIKRKNTRS